MIRALIFDLDGTLVQTERLKAISYARAAIDLCSDVLQESDVIEAFKDVVGLSRQTVATALVTRFNLEAKARERMPDFGVSTPWQAYVQVRLKIYEQMLSDPEIIRSNQWPHTVSLLHEARRVNCKVGLATMSHCPQTRRVLEILELADRFDFIATREDVENGKPDPEMYLLVADELGVSPADCLVIEDSPTGVQAAVNAGMMVIAVSTPFTKQRLHESDLLEESSIVDEPMELLNKVTGIFDGKI